MSTLPKRVPGQADAQEQRLATQFSTVRTIGRAAVQQRGGVTCPPRSPLNPDWFGHRPRS